MIIWSLGNHGVRIRFRTTSDNGQASITSFKLVRELPRNEVTTEVFRVVGASPVQEEAGC